MRHALLLAWRHLAYYWGRTTILAACVALTFVLPVAVQVLVSSYSESVAARAASTPLVAGAKGSRYDLVLNSLYFRGRVPNPLKMAEVGVLRASGLGTPIPLLVRHRARDRPIVGTTPDYFDFRGLRLAAGTRPLLLGEAVLGAEAAADLGLGVGQKLLSDQANVYDLTLGYPLRMQVVGVLAEAGTPDDGAVFVDLKTAWLLDGIGHGHLAAERQGEDQVLVRKAERDVVLNASVVEYTEITEANIDSFHFHEAPAELPITGVLVVPRDGRAATLLKGRYRVSESAQLLEPAEVVAEILGFVFRIKAFFDANVAVVSAATVLFLALIVLLSVRVRQPEIDTLFRIGCARPTVFRLMATELALTVTAGFAAAALLAGALVFWVETQQSPL